MILSIFTVFLYQQMYGEQIDLSLYEQKVYSQNGEDGILKKIFDVIGTTNKYYVEFGTENCQECNTRYLREHFGWAGLLMDARYSDPSINLHQHYITAENINELFKEYKVPLEFDLLSIDIDFNDFYVWQAIGSKYRPRVVIIEYNSSHPPSADKVVHYKPNAWWDGTNYFGASILSYYKLAQQKGYSLVYAERNGVNCFFIRNDVLSHLSHTFKDLNNVTNIYQNFKNLIYHHLPDVLNRAYISADELLRTYKEEL